MSSTCVMCKRKSSVDVCSYVRAGARTCACGRSGAWTEMQIVTTPPRMLWPPLLLCTSDVYGRARRRRLLLLKMVGGISITCWLQTSTNRC